MECVDESAHDAGHVDARVDHPLQLKTVGCCLDHASECVGIEGGALLFGAEAVGDRLTQAGAAVEEVLVGRMLGVGGVDREA